MKVLVTGGAGFIGSHIVDMLILEGCSVVVVDNLISGEEKHVNPQAAFHQVDILDSAIDDVLKKEAPEVILHQAALVFVQQSIKDPLADGSVNMMGTLNLLRSAKLHNVKKFVYASTCAVYGEGQSEAVSEDFPASPRSFYGASKYMGEVYVRLYHELYGMDYTILRYGNVYGPRQKPHGEGGVIPIFIQHIKSGIPPAIFGTGAQSRDFIYVKDIASANLQAIHRGSRQTLNLGTGQGTTIKDLYRKLTDIMGSNLCAQHRPALPGDVKHIVLNQKRAQKELEWEIGYSLAHGLAETVAFAEARGGMK